MDEQKADPACRRQRLRRFGLVYAILCSGLMNGTPSPAQMPGQEAGVSLPSAAPRFSIPGGFYDEPTVLALVGDDAQTALYYTLDGSVPSDAAQRYESPIPLNETVVVRTLAITSGQAPSPVLTQTYFVGERHSVPVISLVASPADLWDEDTGIYVFGKNAESERPYFGANFWQDWEIPVHIEFFEPDGKLGFSMGAGMKIQGGMSRAAPQKSLALFARSRYGKGRIRYQVFPDLDIDAFEALVLRNSGNDWGFTMMRDALGGPPGRRARS